MSKSIVILLTGAVLLGGVCTGCNKFTRERYETVYIGMPKDEVKMRLGRPDATFSAISDSWIYINEKPFCKAIIQFKGGRVFDKAWYDERGMDDHPDSKSQIKGGPKEALEKRTTVP